MTAATAGSITDRPPRVLALPKDPNPYQELLYTALRDRGVVVEYAGELTASRTANQLLLPMELVWRRARGFNTLHIHWLFGFRFAGAGRIPALLNVSRHWLGLVLSLARRLGYRIVWTAHNVLPHSAIFDDDVKARRRLVRACDLVIVHAANAVDGLTEIDATPSQVATIPPGTYDLPGFSTLRPPPDRPPTRLLYFGLVSAYKGVEDLLAATAQLQSEAAVVVAGECRDVALAQRIAHLSDALAHRCTLILRRVDDDEIAGLFESVHAVVLPFRSVTTSSSVILGLASGRAVVIPDLPAFADIPADAVIRYAPGEQGLGDVLERVAGMPSEDLLSTGARGRAFALSHTWDDVALATDTALRALL